MPAEPTLFEWISDWWRQNGSATDKRVEFPGANGVTAVSEKNAAPIGDGLFSVKIRYTAPEPVTVTVYTTVFANLGGTGTKNDTARIRAVVPAAKVCNTVDITLEIKASGRLSFRPVLNFDKAILVEDVSVSVLTPVSYIRDHDSVGIIGPNPRPQRLTAKSIAGDYGVLFVSSGWGDCPHRPPAGWDYRLSARVGASGRSGYVAIKKIESPSETQNLNPWGEGEDNPSAARDQATLVTVTSQHEPKLFEWSEMVPAGNESSITLAASAFHGVAAVQEPVWTAEGGPQYIAGGKSTVASWSSQRVQAITSKITLPDEAVFPAWAAVTFMEDRKFTFKVYTGSEEKPVEANLMPRGAKDVDTLLNKRGFVVAHRGGSSDWPEMSMKAYTNSVAYGVDALEISCHRTSDGVWFGTHDSTLTRVDPTAPNRNVYEMTWNEVKGYTTKGEPLLKLDDFLEVYGETHVIFADPKHSASNIGEFCRKFDPKHTIIKFSADATWLADQARAHGFKTWGYAYSAHIASGQLAQWAPHWDILGMEITETMEPFDQAKTIIGDKPLMAHILPNKAWYDKYRNAAAGCMVSGIDSVMERIKV